MVKLVETQNPEINDHASIISLSVYDEDASDFSDSGSINYEPKVDKDKMSPPNKLSPPE